jgi:hypothetical protein
MVMLVQAYIANPSSPDEVDWPFVFKVTMTKREDWAAEDKARHASAMATLLKTGYEVAKPAASKAKPKGASPKAKKAAAKLAKKGKAARGGKGAS